MYGYWPKLNKLLRLLIVFGQIWRLFSYIFGIKRKKVIKLLLSFFKSEEGETHANLCVCCLPTYWVVHIPIIIINVQSVKQTEQHTKNPLNSIFSCCLARLFTLRAVVPHFVVNYSGNKTMRNAAAKQWSTKRYLGLVRKLINISSFFGTHLTIPSLLFTHLIAVWLNTCTTRRYIIIFAPAWDCMSKYWVWVIIVNYWLSSTSANSQSAGTFWVSIRIFAIISRTGGQSQKSEWILYSQIRRLTYFIGH